MSIAVIDYNAGNIRSVLFALERLGVKAALTSDPDKIHRAAKVIFPGDGEAGSTMEFLANSGLDEVIKSLKQPVLGICIGMQLLCEYSEESHTPCLGLVPQHVKKFKPLNGEKVPHMGWNTLHETGGDLFDKSMEGQFVYFVHSYYVEPGDYTCAVCHYTTPFSAGIQKDNFFATQFHPEKSGTTGEKILKNFLKI